MKTFSLWMLMLIIAAVSFLRPEMVFAQTATTISITEQPSRRHLSFAEIAHRANGLTVAPSDQRLSIGRALNTLKSALHTSIPLHPYVLVCLNAGPEGAFRLRYRMNHVTYRVTIPFCRGTVNDWVTSAWDESTAKLNALFPAGVTMNRAWISLSHGKRIKMPHRTIVSPSRVEATTQPAPPPAPMVVVPALRLAPSILQQSFPRPSFYRRSLRFFNRYSSDIAYVMMTVGLVFLASMLSQWHGYRKGYAAAKAAEESNRRHELKQQHTVLTEPEQSLPVVLTKFVLNSLQPNTNRANPFIDETPDYGVRTGRHAPAPTGRMPSALLRTTAHTSASSSSSVPAPTPAQSFFSQPDYRALLHKWVEEYGANPAIPVDVRRKLNVLAGAKPEQIPAFMCLIVHASLCHLVSPEVSGSRATSLDA